MSSKKGHKSGSDGAASNGKAPAPSPANAWARPLKTTGPPPGMGPSKAAGAAAKNGVGMASVNRERLLHLSLTLVGQKVTVTQTNGAVLEGIFHTFTPFKGLALDMKNKYVLNAVKTIKAASEKGDKNSAVEDGSTVIIPVEKVVYIHANNINLERVSANGGSAYTAAGGKNDVITDTQISGRRAGGNGDLVAAGSAWTASGGNKSRAEALAGAPDEKGGMTRKGFGTAKAGGNLQGNIGEWDQFKANSELFNVNATFDENLYTTELDKSQIDSKKIAKAERIAREIEKTASSNMHVAEERGQVVETDCDEEDRYSGVLTKEGKQRHDAKEGSGKKGDKVAKAAASAPRKIMNYAAAAAKADAGKKAAPPGFSASKTSPDTPDSKSTEKAAKVTPDEKKAKEASAGESKGEKADAEKSKGAPKEAEKAVDDKETKEEAKKDTEDKPKEKVEDKPKEKTEEAKKETKLNANAKSFTFNPSAKSFTPTFGGGAASFTPPQQQPQHIADPAMQMHAGGHPMQPPHYMHAAPMGQPGMMPMMNPQYAGMRGYPPQYAGMDQHGNPQMQPHHQPQHVQAPGAPAPAPVAAQSSGAPAPVPTQSGPPAPGGEEKSEPKQQPQEGEASQPAAPQQQQPPQQQMQMPYNVPPQGAYYAGGAMPMHPRAPGYPPQFVGGPQQMSVPGGAPYRQMYPMQPGGMPPNMMRGPGGAPYYPGPNGPMPYPPAAYGVHGMMDESDSGYRARGGRGPGGRGRGRRGGRGRGPGGRGNYQQYGGRSGPPTPQQQQGPAGESNGAGEAAPQAGDNKPNETSTADS